jgi:hypothetical protein
LYIYCRNVPICLSLPIVDAEEAVVLKGVHQLLDEEAVRVVSMLKGFIPGKQGGQAVDVYYMVPVNFSLPTADLSR